MATISNSSRINGLASGLDTESIVKGLTQGTQTKIDQEKQKLQILEWKQEYYQETADKLYEFQTKYFGTSSFSMLFSNELNSLAATNSGSDYVTVTTSPDSVSGNVFISDIVSLATAAKVKSTAKVSSDPVLTVDPDQISSLSGKSMSVSLDGITKTITFSSSSSETIASDLQSLLDNAFGSNRVTVSSNGNELSLHSDNSVLVIKASGIEGFDASAILSFKDGASNRVNLDDTLADVTLAASPGDIVFSVNGKEFSFTSENTLREIMTTVNNADVGATMSYSNISDTFAFTATETGAGSSITFEGASAFYIADGVYANGSNAVVKVGLNGETDEASLLTIERSSNSFEIDGSTYTLLKKASGDITENITIGVAADTEALAEKITQFVTDYNALLSSVTDKLSEKKYSAYPPLTDAQKADMTDDQIKLWNEKAQSGLLRNDTYLTSIYNNLRSAWFSDVSALGGQGATIGISLVDIGISTGEYSEKGQLKVDKNKLLNALNKDSAVVTKLLNQTASISYSQYATTEQQKTRYDESGLIWRINDIVRNSLNTTGTKGALVELIGSPSNSFSGKTSYSKQITDKNDKIADLQEKLTEEENRYWKKFSAMESSLTSLNAMGAWITSQFSSSSSN